MSAEFCVLKGPFSLSRFDRIDAELTSAFYRTCTHLFGLLATLLRKAGAVALPAISAGLAERWAVAVGKWTLSRLGAAQTLGERRYVRL